MCVYCAVYVLCVVYVYVCVSVWGVCDVNWCFFFSLPLIRVARGIHRALHRNVDLQSRHQVRIHPHAFLFVCPLLFLTLPLILLPPLPREESVLLDLMRLTLPSEHFFEFFFLFFFFFFPSDLRTIFSLNMCVSDCLFSVLSVLSFLDCQISFGFFVKQGGFPNFFLN